MKDQCFRSLFMSYKYTYNIYNNYLQTHTLTHTHTLNRINKYNMNMKRNTYIKNEKFHR